MGDNGGAQRLRPVIFDILNYWSLASTVWHPEAMGGVPIIGGRVG